MKLTCLLALAACSHAAPRPLPPASSPVDDRTPLVVLVPYNLAASTIDGQPFAYPIPRHHVDAAAVRSVLAQYEVTAVGIYANTIDVELAHTSSASFATLTALLVPMCSATAITWSPAKTALVRDGFTADGGIAHLQMEEAWGHWRLQCSVEPAGLLLRAVQKRKLVANPAFVLHETVTETPGEVEHDQCARWHAEGRTCDPVAVPNDFFANGPSTTHTRDRQAEAADLARLPVSHAILSCGGAWHVATTLEMSDLASSEVRQAMLVDTKVTAHARIDALTGEPLEHCD